MLCEHEHSIEDALLADAGGGEARQLAISAWAPWLKSLRDFTKAGGSGDHDVKAPCTLRDFRQQIEGIAHLRLEVRTVAVELGGLLGEFERGSATVERRTCSAPALSAWLPKPLI